MGLINFQYVLFVIISAAFILGGTINSISRGEYLEAAVLLSTIPAAYMIAAITPWLRSTQTRKIIATPIIAVALIFVVAFTFRGLGLV